MILTLKEGTAPPKVIDQNVQNIVLANNSRAVDLYLDFNTNFEFLGQVASGCL